LYPISDEFVAVKNAGMEQARYEVEEHRLVRVLAGKIITLPAREGTSAFAPACGIVRAC
jgi:hypothetical protein